VPYAQADVQVYVTLLPVLAASFVATGRLLDSPRFRGPAALKYRVTVWAGVLLALVLPFPIHRIYRVEWLEGLIAVAALGWFAAWGWMQYWRDRAESEDVPLPREISDGGWSRLAVVLNFIRAAGFLPLFGLIFAVFLDAAVHWSAANHPPILLWMGPLFLGNIVRASRDTIFGSRPAPRSTKEKMGWLGPVTILAIPSMAVALGRLHLPLDTEWWWEVALQIAAVGALAFGWRSVPPATLPEGWKLGWFHRDPNDLQSYSHGSANLAQRGGWGWVAFDLVHIVGSYVFLLVFAARA
jgi:hypothetical protein